MPISETLKKILQNFKLLPEINIDVKIANKTVNIEHSNFNTLILNPQTEKYAKDLFEKADFGFGRKDLAPIESEIAYQTLDHRQIIKKIKPYLISQDVGALTCSATVIRLEDKQDKEADTLYKKLRECYGARGRKIYNMLRSKIYEGSNIFESIICPFLDIAQSKYPDDPFKVRGIFTKFFEDILMYYPYGIWINKPKEVKDYQIKVLGRLRRESLPISVYARGKSCIDTAIEVCKFVIENDSELALEREDYELGKDIACMLTLHKK